MKNLVIVLLLTLLLNSCNDSTSPKVEKETTYSLNLIHYLELKKPDFINDSNLIGYINFNIYNLGPKENLVEDTVDLIITQSFAKFCNSSPNSSYSEFVGNMSLNNVDLKYACIDIMCEECNALPDCFYENNDFEQFSFYGQQFNWIFKGNSTIEAFQKSIQAPNYSAKIITPTFKDYIRRDIPLIIKWENSGNTSRNQVKIWLNGINKDYSKSKTYFTNDTGSFIIPVKDLQDYNDSDNLQVKLSIGVNDFLKLNNDKFVLFEIFSEYSTAYIFSK